MSLNRVARHVLLFFVLGLLFRPLTASAATTEFFVDYARTSSGDGSSANPWKYRSDINWTVIAGALQTNSVTIYFSSRATWNDDQYVTIPINTSASAARPLILDGQSRYNTVASGAAAWQTEVAGNRATLTTVGGSGGSVLMKNNNAYITIRGFRLLAPTWGGINLGEENPTLNVHDILIENNVVDTPANNHGIWFGYAEAGCYNITVRNNTLINVPLEAIYIGHYNYLPDTITGVVVEYNTIINSGTRGEGDIDIKAGAFGAIVRYNSTHSTTSGGTLAGVVVQASDVQVYGNTLHNLRPHDVSDGGNGIQFNADGDGLGNGKTLNNLLVYNNLIYGNAQRGISMYATATGARITNAKVLNNTIVSNGAGGFHTSGDVSHPITFAAFENNIIASNGSYAMRITNGVSFTSLNYNLYFGTGALFRYQDAEITWSQWKALGFDGYGVNADPQLDGSFLPTAGSPVIGAGIAKSEFSTDKAIHPRAAPWEIGAFEYGGAAVPVAPKGLKIVP